MPTANESAAITPNEFAVEALLLELVQLTRVLVYPVASTLLRDEFFENEQPRVEKVKVYAALEGNASQREVAEKAGVNQSSVSRWANEWKRKGLVNPNGRAVFRIYDFFPELQRISEPVQRKRSSSPRQSNSEGSEGDSIEPAAQ